MTRLTVITFLISLITVKSFGQSSARAILSATITEAVGTQKLEDLRFGSFAMDAKPGAIEIRSGGLPNASGGVKLNSDTASGVALFYIINHHQEYSVSVPSAITVIKKGGAETMKVGAFTLHIKEDNKNGATQMLAIGATIYAGAFQAAGEYVAATPLTVTVNYN